MYFDELDLKLLIKKQAFLTADLIDSIDIGTELGGSLSFNR